MKAKRPARKASKPKVASNVRDSAPPHASRHAKAPVKKRDRPSPKPVSGAGAPDPPAPDPAVPAAELPPWVADLDGELSGLHAEIRKLLPRKPGGRFSRKTAFLHAFAQCASVTRAAQAAGVSRTMHYEWLETDRKYKAAFDTARERAGQVLEDEAVRRAYQGTVKPVYYVGQLCGGQREYSDGMLQMLLKGAKPEKYRERVDHNHNKGDGWSGTGSEAMALYRKLTMKEE